MTPDYVNWIPWAPEQSEDIHSLFMHSLWTSKNLRVRVTQSRSSQHYSHVGWFHDPRLCQLNSMGPWTKWNYSFIIHAFIWNFKKFKSWCRPPPPCTSTTIAASTWSNMYKLRNHAIHNIIHPYGRFHDPRLCWLNSMGPRTKWDISFIVNFKKFKSLWCPPCTTTTITALTLSNTYNLLNYGVHNII
jgi:hypothetical protein